MTRSFKFRKWDPTRYRLKKDLPGIKAGEIFTMDGGRYIAESYCVDYHFKPISVQQCTDWFEKVEEKSDADIVTLWMRDFHSKFHYEWGKKRGQISADFSDLYCEDQSQMLIDYGVDVDRIRREAS